MCDTKTDSNTGAAVATDTAKVRLLRCPNCKSFEINQYRMPTGSIWCEECGYRVENKEVEIPFKINKCDANQKNIEKLASDWFSQMTDLYDKYYNEDKNRWKIRQAEDVYKTLMLCRAQMLSCIGVKFID